MKSWTFVAAVSMSSLRQLSLLLIASALAFGGAFALRTRPARAGTRATAAARPISDSAWLASVGAAPGRQLAAYVLVSADCGFCQQRATKDALRLMRVRLGRNAGARFSAVSVIGVAADKNVDAGLSYIASIGNAAFDQVSVGGGWLNDEVVNVLWRGTRTRTGTPQVILVSRPMTATARPFSLTYGADSLLGVVGGRDDIVAWVTRGARLDDSIVTTGVFGIKRQTTVASETTPAR